MPRFAAGTLALPLVLALAGPAAAVDVAAQLVLSLPGNFERNVVRYQCEGLEPFVVDYINAHPNFLAVLPVGGESLVFASTLSASGVRYVSGQHEWWTKGTDATLADLTAPEGTAPLACVELSQTP